MFNSFKKYFSLIKISHTVFALPFALIGFSLALNSGHAIFNWQKLILVLLCMIFARSAAMSFNRYIDRQFDKKNPRTAIREIPSGQVTPIVALNIVVACSIAFIICSYLINPLCFFLSPIALVVILGYSYTKRFTVLCHLFLGLGLSLSPIGAYLAITEKFETLPLLFSAIVFLWTAGFDIIYSLQDDVFDKSQNLKSIPVFLGRKKALQLSKSFHFIAASLVIAAYFLGNFGWLYLIGAAVFLAILIYQQFIVKANDLSKVNFAFATLNGIGSIIFGVFVCTDLLLKFK